MKLKVLDLFAGIGGFSLGLDRTGGFETVAFCEIDKAAQKVLKKHWPSVPVYEDVKLLKGEDFGTVDVITGGFPCQDISLAGKGAGLAGERSGLWWEYHRLIKEIKPKYVIAENVSALRSRGLDEVLRSLSEIGYDAEWHCIPASAVGAPHRRDRIWIVAYPRHGSRRDIRTTQEGDYSQNQRTAYSDSSSRSGEQPSSLANPDYSGSGTFKHGVDTKRSEAEQEWQVEPLSWSSRRSKVMANPSLKGLEGQRTRTICSEQEQPMSSSSGCVVRYIHKASFWEVEPHVGRVADGVPNRVDRLKQLGNAVVPQIPELIGRAILLREERENCT